MVELASPYQRQQRRRGVYTLYMNPMQESVPFIP